MDYRSPIIRHFYCFFVGNIRKKLHIFKLPWVASHHTRDIFPDCHILGIQTIGKNRRRIVRPLTPQRNRKVIFIRTYKPLSNIGFRFIQLRNIFLCIFPVYHAFTVVGIGFYKIPSIQPLVTHFIIRKIHT